MSLWLRDIQLATTLLLLLLSKHECLLTKENEDVCTSELSEIGKGLSFTEKIIIRLQFII